MKNYKKAFLLAMGVLTLWQALKLRSLDAQSSGTDVGVTLNPSIQITLTEGTNQFGKKTILLGNNIDFGTVTFTHPEAVSNGDAYVESGFLRLEAVLNVGVVFGGVSSVGLDLKKLKVSPTPFHQVYYSLSMDRSSVNTTILEDPLSNRLSTLTGSDSVPLKLIFEINPSQKGRLTDRLRLEANAL